MYKKNMPKFRKLHLNIIKKRKQTTASKSDGHVIASNMDVKFGHLIFEVYYGTIRLLSLFASIALAFNFIFGLKLFTSAIGIRSELGYFLNLITDRDGDILPSCQALPVFFFMLLNIGTSIAFFKVMQKRKEKNWNTALLVLLILSFVMIIITFIIVIVILAHIYSSHPSLHNGIIDAMRNYSTNSRLKRIIDKLQIEFQCCGSKKYDEWYNIKWQDESLLPKGKTQNKDGNTPFSCCLMSSIYPCIHHYMEVTGKTYLYTPEFNLSISTDGCYKRIRERKQSVGGYVIGNLFLFLFMQIIIFVCLRFIQTGHLEKYKYCGYKRTYKIWLIGIGSAKPVVVPADNVAPEPPPVPPELMD